MLIGHQKQWQFLKKAIELEKISRTFLFFGEEKLGKKTLALEFIKSAFGQDIREKAHPDFILIEPSRQGGGVGIQIAQIRDLIWRLSLKPFSAPFKAAIIDQAHLMNKEAQNCFLKTLEEPRGDTLLILITEYPKVLLPTILSRVEAIRFLPVPLKEIEAFLRNQELSEAEIQELSSLSLGRPGRVIDFYREPRKRENQKEKIKEVIKLNNSRLSFRFQYAKELSREPQNLKEILDIWLRYFRELLLSNLKGEAVSNNYSLNKLKNILRVIQNTKFLISTTNVNPRLALETLMLELE